MRFLPVLLFFFFLAAVRAQGPEYDDDYGYYIMADDDFGGLSYNDFEIMGGPAYALPVTSKQQPPSFASNNPITLPIQTSTEKMVTLPVQMATNKPINMAPVVHNEYLPQPITQYRYVEQPIIQPRLIEQPKLQERIVHQPIYRQIVTQPVVVPRITTQPIITQRVIDQPIYQHRLIERTTIQPELTDVPVTNKAMQAKATNVEAAPIMNQEHVSAQPIYRQAPTITQEPVTQPLQMPRPVTSKKGAYNNF
jgi:hypothetical protein